MPKTSHVKQLKAKGELNVILTLLRVPESSAPEPLLIEQLVVHRLAALVKAKPNKVNQIISAMSKDLILTSRFESIATRLIEPATKKIDPEVAEEFVPTPLSGRALRAAVLQQGLKIGTLRVHQVTDEDESQIIRSILNPVRLNGKQEHPIKLTGRIETGSTEQWTGMGIAHDQ